MTELAAAYEIAKNFPSGIGGFFGSIVGGIITALYLRKMLLSYLAKTIQNEIDIKETKDDVAKINQEILLIKAHVGLK